MASNITSSGSFATALMKPASGEQIDALWGQNIADNTGFLRTSEIGYTSWYGAMAGTAAQTGVTDFYLSGSRSNPIFIPKGHNKLYGNFFFEGTFHQPGVTNPQIAGTWKFALEGDLGTYQVTGGTTGIGYADVTMGTAIVIDVNPRTYVSSGSWANLRLNYWGSSWNSASGNRTMWYSFTEAPLFRSTWA